MHQFGGWLAILSNPLDQPLHTRKNLYNYHFMDHQKELVAT